MKFASRKSQFSFDLRGDGPGEGGANRGRLINRAVYRLISRPPSSGRPTKVREGRLRGVGAAYRRPALKPAAQVFFDLIAALIGEEAAGLGGFSGAAHAAAAE
jgi:hypothetical protein